MCIDLPVPAGFTATEQCDEIGWITRFLFREHDETPPPPPKPPYWAESAVPSRDSGHPSPTRYPQIRPMG